MPQATFVQDGCAVDYTPGVAVAAGAVVVQGDLVGIAKRPIAANDEEMLEQSRLIAEQVIPTVHKIP